MRRRKIVIDAEEKILLISNKGKKEIRNSSNKVSKYV